MINGEFYVKKVSEVSTTSGEIPVRTVTFARKVCKFGDSGSYPAEELYACELAGRRASEFPLKEGDRVVAIIVPDIYTVTVKDIEVDRPVNRLSRYCLL